MLQDSRLISAIVAAAHALDQQTYAADADRGEYFYGMQAIVYNNILQL